MRYRALGAKGVCTLCKLSSDKDKVIKRPYACMTRASDLESRGYLDYK